MFEKTTPITKDDLNRLSSPIKAPVLELNGFLTNQSIETNNFTIESLFGEGKQKGEGKRKNKLFIFDNFYNKLLEFGEIDQAFARYLYHKTNSPNRMIKKWKNYLQLKYYKQSWKSQQFDRCKNKKHKKQNQYFDQLISESEESGASGSGGEESDLGGFGSYFKNQSRVRFGDETMLELDIGLRKALDSKKETRLSNYLNTFHPPDFSKASESAEMQYSAKKNRAMTNSKRNEKENEKEYENENENEKEKEKEKENRSQDEEENEEEEGKLDLKKQKRNTFQIKKQKFSPLNSPTRKRKLPTMKINKTKKFKTINKKKKKKIPPKSHTKNTINPKNYRYSKPIDAPKDWESWSNTKKRSWNSYDTNPNAFYFRHTEKGTKPKLGKWTKQEKELFFTRIKKVGTGNWGNFSRVIPLRTGNQCSSFFRRQLQEDNEFFKKWGSGFSKDPISGKVTMDKVEKKQY
ncbi:snRNA-activating protein complex subunit 4 [Anaeramoeba flamelloides]|uniref:snRNA-activating protein complex subunit 4 n=1 Tax=Anaeramoeba flamelloides TaxID=1746091 RepID=A0ABQ8XYP2_9EUKA|nr:snRNA-activating protein complex subunit 4 [Anaeramoeba flamelloides]